MLTAVDAALMVIDAANGVEAQTLRLLEVCRARGTPIVTFINKMDREVREPIALLEEIERALGMPCAPLTWPVGQGKEFRGIYDLRRDDMRVFEPGADRRTGEDEIVADPALLRERFGAAFETAWSDIDIVRHAAPAFDRADFLAGRQTPVLFGSAINNFGVREVLDAVVDLVPPPGPRLAQQREVRPDESALSRRGLQDPGQHGSGAPRPHRLPAPVFRALRARHVAVREPYRQDPAADRRGDLPFPAARPGG